MGTSVRLLAVLAILVAGAAWPARATAGGFEVGDQGARAMGRAGAFAAKADDLSAVEYNPAGLARQRGTRIYLSNRFTFGNEQYWRAPTLDYSNATQRYPSIAFSELRQSHVSNQTPNQYLGPMMGVSTDFGLKDWGFALSVYAPAGTESQDFPQNGPQKYMLVGRKVEILYYNASVAWKYKDIFGIGATLQWVDLNSLQFNLVIDGNTTAGLVSPVSSRFDILSKMDGADHVNVTGILGMWFRPQRGVEFAVSARLIPVWFKAKSTLSLTALNLKLDKPPAITRNGKPDNNVTFSFVIPPKLRVGARYVFERDGRERGDIELDFGYEAWSMLDAFTMDGTGLVSTVMGQNVPIGKITVPRHWQDTWSVRLGGDWNVVPEHFTLRGGFFYESAAAPDAYAYIDLFPFQRFGPSVGFSVDFKGFDLSASYSYVFQMPLALAESDSKVYQQTPGSPCKAPYTDPTQCSPNYLGQPGAVSNAGVYVSSYHFLSVALQYHF